MDGRLPQKFGGRLYCTWQFFVTFLGWLSDPFQWLSDLQLGDEKVTLNHLVNRIFLEIFWLLNSSNVQPDNESLLMINSSHGVDFVFFFGFSCRKTGRLLYTFLSRGCYTSPG